MTGQEEAAQSLNFKDRKVRLVVLGILQIILGGICALIAFFLIFRMTAFITAGRDAAGNAGFRDMMPGILFYVFLAVWFIWMGIGSVITRRWARALILVSSWIWLICGTLGFIFMLPAIPNIYNKMGESGQMLGAAEMTVITFMVGFYIIVPALLVLFYSGRNVKSTVEYRDPKKRWTDECPLPVLAVSLASVGWAVSMLWTGMIYKWAIPFFGVILSGVLGAAVIAALILLLAYMVWGTYKLDMKAWWCTLTVIVGWSLSTLITFWRVGIQGYYDKMGFSCRQIELVKQCSVQLGSKMNLFFSFWAVAIIVYLIYVRRYFSRDL